MSRLLFFVVLLCALPGSSIGQEIDFRPLAESGTSVYLLGSTQAWNVHFMEWPYRRKSSIAHMGAIPPQRPVDAVMHIDVQADLRLTPAQIKRIEESGKRLEAKMTKDSESLRNESSSHSKRQKIYLNYLEAKDRQVREILNEPQLQRLLQICHQAELHSFFHPLVFSDPLKKKLVLTDDQQKALTSLSQMIQKEERLAMAEMAVTLDRALVRAVLTNKQYAQLRDRILGPRFDWNLKNSYDTKFSQVSPVTYQLPKGHLPFRHDVYSRDGTAHSTHRSSSSGSRITGGLVGNAGLPDRWLFILLMEPVWRQLKINPVQAKSLLEMEEQDRIRRLKVDEQAQRTRISPEQGRRELARWEDKHFLQLFELLDFDQLRRLKQIRAQFVLTNEGIDGLTHPAFATLVLTEKQASRIRREVAQLKKRWERDFFQQRMIRLHQWKMELTLIQQGQLDDWLGNTIQLSPVVTRID